MMSMDTLYDLRVCLEEAAIAGTNSPDTERRIRHAADAIPAGAELDHIRGRMGTWLRADEKARPALLLELLGTIYAEERFRARTIVGEPEPLEPGHGACLREPYSRLQPVIDALTGSGSARVTILEDAWENDRELFSDLRVLPYLAAAPGEAYGELEELLAGILTAQGTKLVPYLKAPAAGRRDAERRIYWTARLAGGAENDWYLSLLPKSRDEARETLIAALGTCGENAELLRRLYREETGKCRDAALRSLARMEDEESRLLWEEELTRQPDCPSCLEGVDSRLASDLAAELLRGAFSEALSRGTKELSRSELLTLAHAIFASFGKFSDAMRETWLWCAEQMEALDTLTPGPDAGGWELSAAEMLEKCLLETVLWNPCEELLSFTRELGERYPARFLGAAVLTLLVERPAEAFDRYGKYIVKNTLFHKETPAERANRVQIMKALASIRNDEKEGLRIPFSRKDSLTGATAGRLYRLREVDPRWIETLEDPKVNTDGAVFDLRDPWGMTRQTFRTEALVC